MLKHLKRTPSSKGRTHNLPLTPPSPASKEDASAQSSSVHLQASSSTSGRLPQVPSQEILPVPGDEGIGGRCLQQAASDPAMDRSKPLPLIRHVRPSTSASQTCQHTLNPASTSAAAAAVATEKWTSPEDADGAYIRQTYAHFDARGVRGDGLVEGKEWTRERGDRPAWEASEDGATLRKRRTSMPPVSSKTMQHLSNIPGNGVLTSDNDRQRLLSPLSGRGGAHQSGSLSKDSNASFHSQVTPPSPSSSAPPPPASRSVSTDAEDPQSSALPCSTELIRSGFGGSVSSLGSHSEASDRGVSAAIEEDDEIELERKELMTKIDRYGFFPRTHAQSVNGRIRMAILSEAGLRTIPKRRLRHLRAPPRPTVSTAATHSRAQGPMANRSNGSSDSQDDETQTFIQRLHTVIQQRSEKETLLQEREAIRARKWDRMLKVERIESGKPSFILASGTVKSSKLRRRVYKGVPDRWRAAVWWALLQVRLSDSHTMETQASASQHEASFWPLQQRPSPQDVQIDLDVPRTISGHILFHTRYGQGQRALFHVLHAFSLYCPDCAYCQGMGPIAATMLVYFSPERAYAAMVELHNDAIFGIHQTFLPGFPGLVENFYVQHALLRHLCPDVAKAMDASGVVASAYATKWYITLYTNVVPFATQLRLWDAYFMHGRDVLVVTAVAILWSLRADLLHSSFESSMGLLGREFVPVDDDLFLNWIYTVMQREDTRKCLNMARKQWAVLVKQGDTPLL